MSTESGNKLKLGVFGANLEGGFTATKAPDKHSIDWETIQSVAQKADRAGWEIQVPLARFASLGGETDFCGVNLEPLTWAAGVAAVTNYSKIFATIHPALIHPVLAAKQMTTIDRISNGRFGINIAAGWNPKEFGMFGAPMLPKNETYAHAQEWLDIVDRLWSEDAAFDFQGKFFDVKDAWIQPKPISSPRPLVMNAGRSEEGAAFAARNAEVVFSTELSGDDPEATRKRFGGYRAIGAERGRKLDIWGAFWVICRDTEQEARDYERYILEENGDYAVIDGLDPQVLRSTEGLPEEKAKAIRTSLLAAFGAHRIVGTPDQIVEQLVASSESGIDGLAFIFPNYEDGIDAFNENVIPRLEQKGLRKPFQG